MKEFFFVNNMSDINAFCNRNIVYLGLKNKSTLEAKKTGGERDTYSHEKGRLRNIGLLCGFSILSFY